MTTITLIGGGGPVSSPGVNFDLHKMQVPLPSTAVWSNTSDLLNFPEIPPSTVRIWEGALIELAVTGGHVIVQGDLEIRETPEVHGYTPEEGYFVTFHYEWTLNDNSAITSITFNSDTQNTTVGIDFFPDALPYSQVADRTVADFITDGTGIRGWRVSDVLNMTDHDEFVSGDDGHDTISGLGGDDTLYGDAGNDRLNGGAGNDLLNGGDGIDIADYSTVVGTGLAIDLSLGRVYIGSDVDRLFAIEDAIGTAASDSLSGTAEANRLEGGLGHDRIDGRAGHDFLVGGAGDDRLIGGFGDDLIQGGAGADRLYGDDGNDRLIGGTQSDKLTGAAGADTFVFLSPFDGHDQLLDFTAGEDRIEISRLGFGLAADAALATTSEPLTWDIVSGGTVRGSLLYDTTSGWLRWDSTPAVAGDAIHIATLPHSQLTISDFILA